MKRLEVSGTVRPIYGSLGVKRLQYSTSYLLQKTTVFNLYGVVGVIVSGPPYGKTVSASVTEGCSPLVGCSVCNQPRAKFFAQLKPNRA